MSVPLSIENINSASISLIPKDDSSGDNESELRRIKNLVDGQRRKGHKYPLLACVFLQFFDAGKSTLTKPELYSMIEKTSIRDKNLIISSPTERYSIICPSNYKAKIKDIMKKKKWFTKKMNEKGSIEYTLNEGIVAQITPKIISSLRCIKKKDSIFQTKPNETQENTETIKVSQKPANDNDYLTDEKSEEKDTKEEIKTIEVKDDDDDEESKQSVKIIKKSEKYKKEKIEVKNEDKDDSNDSKKVTTVKKNKKSTLMKELNSLGDIMPSKNVNSYKNIAIKIDDNEKPKKMNKTKLIEIKEGNNLDDDFDIMIEDGKITPIKNLSYADDIKIKPEKNTDSEEEEGGIDLKQNIYNQNDIYTSNKINNNKTKMFLSRKRKPLKAKNSKKHKQKDSNNDDNDNSLIFSKTNKKNQNEEKTDGDSNNSPMDEESEKIKNEEKENELLNDKINSIINIGEIFLNLLSNNELSELTNKKINTIKEKIEQKEKEIDSDKKLMDKIMKSEEKVKTVNNQKIEEIINSTKSQYKEYKEKIELLLLYKEIINKAENKEV